MKFDTCNLHGMEELSVNVNVCVSVCVCVRNVQLLYGPNWLIWIMMTGKKELFLVIRLSVCVCVCLCLVVVCEIDRPYYNDNSFILSLSIQKKNNTSIFDKK